MKGLGRKMTDVLRTCQMAAYAALEDMRALYDHEQVAMQPGEGERERVNVFLDLVNRRDFQVGDAPIAPQTSQGVNRLFSLASRDKIKRSKVQAERLLKWYADSAGKMKVLPPPFWLRIMPACINIVRGLNLCSGSPVLRWIAFNVEVPQRDRSMPRVAWTVNVNSNPAHEPYASTGGILMRPVVAESVEHGPCRALSDVLLNLSGAVARPRQNLVEPRGPFPYICWGMRLRTGRPPKDGGPSQWIELVLNAESRGTLPSSLAAYKCPSFDSRFVNHAEKDIVNLVRNWLFWYKEDRGTDKPLTETSAQVRAYCETVAAFYPDGRWPEKVDCLLCPGVFWSMDPRHQGTAATILWGFEGEIAEQTADAILLLSQTLLSGIAQFTRAADVSVSKETGLEQATAAFGHEVKKVASILTGKWIPRAESLLEVAYTEEAKAYWPDKLGRLEIAPQARAYLDNEMRITPFGRQLEAAGAFIKMWCQDDSRADWPSQVRPEKLEAFLLECWRIAVDAVTVWALSKEGSIDSPQAVCRMHLDIADLRAAWLPALQVALPESGRITRIDWGSLAKTLWLGRLLATLMGNCIQHGDPAKPVSVDVATGASPATIQLDLSNSIPVSQDESATVLVSARGLDRKRVARCLDLLSRGAQGQGQVSVGKFDNRNVAERCAEKLEGRVVWPSAPPGPGELYRVGVEVKY